MAGEIPKFVGTFSRTAPGAVAGAPTRHVLHNEAHCAPGSISGPSISQVLDNLTRNASFCHEGVSPTRHGEMPSSRPRDFWGNGAITGKVSIEGTPTARKVRLFDVLTGLLVAEAWSRKDGQYRFDFLDPSREYFVIAHDYVHQFNAVIADWVKPEPTVYP